MKRKNLILLTFSSIILLIFLVFGIKKISKHSKNQEQNFQVIKETYENIIEISGTVDAAKEQKLQALSTGTVMNVFVKSGDVVKKGDIIIQLDDTTEKYNLAKQEYNMAATKITGSQQQIKLMESERLALIQKVNDRKVVATFDGLIAALDVSVGDSLEAKDQVGTLVNIDYLLAEVEIPETDVEKLKIGQKVNFTFSAYKKENVIGTLISWPSIGEVTSRGATVVKAKIRIDDFPEEILPNYSFTGKIQISEPEDFLLVNKLAVGREKNQTFVKKLNSEEKINIKIEPYTNEFVKILEGEVFEGDGLQQILKAQISGTKKGMPKGGAGGPPPRF